MKYPLSLIFFVFISSVPVLAGDNVISWKPVAGTTQPSQEDRQRAMTLSRDAYMLLQQHDIAGAEAKLRDAIAILPNKAVWHFNLACILTGQGAKDAAMDSLQRATECGFTDFTLLENDIDLKALHDLPRYQELLKHKDEIRHHAAELAVAELQQQFGKGYLYEIDEKEKLIFATNTDQTTLDALKASLTAQATSQEKELFSSKPDEFIRVVVPSLGDYRKMMRIRGVAGIYEDQSRTLLAERLGQVMTHEFTHALHAADQRAVGQEHPIWIREGLASMYEAGEFVNGELIPHDNYRLAYLQSASRRGALIPFEKLLKLNGQDFLRGPDLCYGESSSLLLYLYDQKLLRKFYDIYKASYNIDWTGGRALEQTTGTTLPELQKAWTAWMITRKSPALLNGPGGPYLGIHFGEATDGLKIAVVLPGSPGAKADLKTGDIIVGFDAKEIRDYNSFAPILADHKAGDTIKLKVRRGGDYMEVPVVLGQR
jgi:tetratricopeptide (TPR) repeat protein